MHKQTHKPRIIAVLSLAVFLGAVLGLAFALTPYAAQASPAFQGYPVDTETPTVTLTATTDGTATVTPTVTLTVTLGAPAATGTATSLLPVTGADLTQQDGGGGSGVGDNVGLWIAVWLLGLLLIWFGMRARSSKQE